MAQGRNTDSKIASLAASATQYEVPDFGQGSEVGLAVRVSPRGKKTWTFRYRDETGKQKRLSLGTYPNTGLAGARHRARGLNELREAGTDPVAHLASKKAEAERDAASTLEGLFKDYQRLAVAGLHKPNGKPKRLRTLDEEGYFWTRFIGPEFGARSLKSITSREIRSFVARLQQEGHVSSARHSNALLRLLFGMARRREEIEANPMDVVDAPPKPQSRDRVLTEAEIKQVWRALCMIADGRGDTLQSVDDSSPLHMSPSVALCLQLALATAQRDGEIAALHSGELSLGGDHPVWTIPGDRTKNHRTHVVPLSPLAVKIIKSAYSRAALTANTAHDANAKAKQDDGALSDGRLHANGFAFPSPRDPSKPITRHAVSRAMARLRAYLGLAHMTPHDFRRTASTMMTGERIGQPRFIVSRVLNHTSDTGGAAKVTEVYDRNAYLAEKRAALNEWGDELVRLNATP